MSTKQQPLAIVIVDTVGSCGRALRNALPRNIAAHVFDCYAPAILMLRAKAIEAVVLRYKADPDTGAFLRLAEELGVAVIFTDVSFTIGDRSSSPSLPTALAF